MRESCIYEGQVIHQRELPRQHHFSYKLYMMYVDLDDWNKVFNDYWLWSTDKANFASLKRKHYGEKHRIPIKRYIQELVAEKTGQPAGEHVYMLTHLSYAGLVFNPLTVYIVYDKGQQHISALVLEVTNTPWHERYTYVLTEPEHMQNGYYEYYFPKEFHVSPFLEMDFMYHFRFKHEGDKLHIYMANLQDETCYFKASLSLRAKPITHKNMASVLIRYPFMTYKVIGAIYWQALKLWLKKIPFYPHPNH